jgi:FlaA1/EpsC-like NDP-sugar epimerase
VKEFVVFSRTEYKQWEVAQQFPELKISFELGQVDDQEALSRVLRKYRPHTLIYAAAMKHVDRCQENLRSCLESNCLGFLNTLEAAEELLLLQPDYPLAQILYVSTDKACAPINIYGMSKALGEQLVQQYPWFCGERARLLGVRYGNVINSSGSILPVLRSQAADSTRTELTLTDPDMTRFYMTLDESVQLIQDALVYGVSGEIWIPQIPSMRIRDLFEIVAEHSGKSVKVVGVRPGEKIHESLIAPHELRNTVKRQVDGRWRYVLSLQANATGSEAWCCSSDHHLIDKADLKARLARWF